MDGVESETSETEAKELYLPANVGRISSARPEHSLLSRSNDFKEKKNVYEMVKCQQPEFLDDSAADFAPSQSPRTIPGYVAMRPTGGTSFVTMHYEFLPGNHNRPLPSFPALYSVMSQHPYESIKDIPSPVNQRGSQDNLASDFDQNQSFGYFPCNEASQPQDLANYVISAVGSSDDNRQSHAAQQSTLWQRQHGTELPEDEDGYLLPRLVQHHSQTSPHEGDTNHEHEHASETVATYSTLTEDGKEYILPNMASATAENDHSELLQATGESLAERRHETTDNNGLDWRRRGVDQSGYLFSDETSQHILIRNDHVSDRPVSQQILIENMD